MAYHGDVLNNVPAQHGRRRFLTGAAALATAPLVAGLSAGCTSDPETPKPSADSSRVAAATTVTSRRRIGSLEVSSIGLGCQTMPGKLYGPVTSRSDMVTLIRTAFDQGPVGIRAHRRRGIATRA